MADPDDVVLGDACADLVIRDGTVALLGRDEFRRRDVVIAGVRIASVTPDADAAIGETTTVIDAGDRWVVPGFIDAHTHADLHQAVERAQHRILEGGTTAMIADLAEIGPQFGRDGVEAIVDATADLAVDVRVTVAPQPFGAALEPPGLASDEREALAGLLSDDAVVGVGETEWIHVVGEDLPPALSDLYDRARSANKRIVGHGAGCRGERLTVFAALVDNDHESITARDVVARLDRGLHVVGRYGSIRDDLDAVAEAWPDVDAREISLSTDGMWPRELVTEGYMDAVVREAIDRGVAPLDAIRMATLTPARHFELQDQGSIAPGNRANVVVLEDLSEVAVETVVVDGERVVVDGKATDRAAPRRAAYPDGMYEPIDVDVNPTLLDVPASATDGTAVRAIAHESGLLTSETVVEPRREEGRLLPAPERDVCKAALVDVHPDADRGSFAGFVTGLGLDRGAVATSVTWETSGLLGVGTDDADVLAAMNRVADFGGGWAVVADGTPVADFRTPIGGTLADTPVDETAEAYERLERALADLGISDEKPAIPIQTLTTPGVPRLRMSFSGYADILHHTVVGLDPNVSD